MTWGISFGISPHLPLTSLRGKHAHSYCSSDQVCKRMFEALNMKKENGTRFIYILFSRFYSKLPVQVTYNWSSYVWPPNTSRLSPFSSPIEVMTSNMLIKLLKAPINGQILLRPLY